MSGGFILFFGFLALGYIAMSLRAFMLSQTIIEGETRPAMDLLFDGSKNKGKTIEAIVIILLIPVAISWGSSVFDSLNELRVMGAAFYGCLSMLFVLITLELSTLNSIVRPSLAPWKNLLIWACVWDLISIILLLGFIKPAAEALQSAALPAPQFSPFSVYILAIAVLAFIASFAVVLFAIGSQRDS